MARGSSKIGLASRVDADDVVRAPANEERTLEALLVEMGHAAERADGGADPLSFREVDEEVGRPAIDLLVGLSGDHLPVGLFLGSSTAHGDDSSPHPPRATALPAPGRPAILRP